MTIHRNRTLLFVDRSRKMRRQPNGIEAMVWNALRNRNLRGLKFRRQYPIGQYIADFYCAEAKVIIELDGQSHVGKEEYDAKRTAWLESQGLCVMRLSNLEVDETLEEFLELVWRTCVGRMAATTHSSCPSPQPSPRSTEERE